MLDNNDDKDTQRNLFLGLALMALVAIGWSYFFAPTQSSQPPKKPVPAQSAVEEIPLRDQPAPAEPKPAPAPEPAAEQAALPLPPVAESTDPKADEVSLKTPQLDLVFTKVGARIKRATVILGKDGVDSVQLVPDWKDTPDAEAVYPMGLRFSKSFLDDALDQRRWDAQTDPANLTVSFTFEAPGVARVVKTFRVQPDSLVVNVSVQYTNLEAAPRVLGIDQAEAAFSLNWGPNVNSGDANKALPQEVIWRKDGKINHNPTAKLKLPTDASPYSLRTSGAEWAAIKSCYFLVAFKPEFENPECWAVGTPMHFRMGVGAPRMAVAPGQTETRDFKLYVGPTHLKWLKNAWPGLNSAVQFFTSVEFMDTFAKFLLSMLNWFHDHVIANYGVGIIVLTVLVRIVVFPLTLKSMKSMKRMQKLAPEIEKLKQEIGEDQQELQKRMMELYRERGINPLGGCLPLVLQMPVFFAFYRMLWGAFELRRAPFMSWITDLSEPDKLLHLPFTLHLPLSTTGIDSLNILPILGAVAMVISTKIMPQSGPVQNSQQKMMMTIMPVVFSAFCYNLASGLNLYILVSTVLGIGQNYLVHVSAEDLEPKKKKPVTHSRHFYTIAQARKRQLAKDIRHEKGEKGKKERQERKAGRDN